MGGDESHSLSHFENERSVAVVLTLCEFAQQYIRTRVGNTYSDTVGSIHWTQQNLVTILNYIVHKVNLSIDKADGSLYMYYI